MDCCVLFFSLLFIECFFFLEFLFIHGEPPWENTNTFLVLCLQHEPWQKGRVWVLCWQRGQSWNTTGCITHPSHCYWFWNTSNLLSDSRWVEMFSLIFIPQNTLSAWLPSPKMFPKPSTCHSCSCTDLSSDYMAHQYCEFCWGLKAESQWGSCVSSWLA